MGLFSFLFSKHKLLRTTYEAETFRAVFREDEELFLRVEKGEELKRYRELEEYVNSAQFKERRKEIEQLSYKDSEYYKAERQYKALLKVRKLQSYLLIADSEELKGYERVKALPEYQEYQKLKVMVMSAGFDKKLHAVEYKAYQESIADEIRKIGGSGWIHGCIIDIDYYNHVYVNPVDMTVRSYWASDIVNKLVYPTVPALLKNECPELYANYLKLIEGEKSNPLAVKQTKNEVALLPKEYLETDIYKASREIKKMQKLRSNVLATWYDIGSESV